MRLWKVPRLKYEILNHPDTISIKFHYEILKSPDPLETVEILKVLCVD